MNRSFALRACLLALSGVTIACCCLAAGTRAKCCPAEGRSPGPKVDLFVRLDKATYTPADTIVVDVALVNAGDRDTTVGRYMGPGAYLFLEFRDSAGKKVQSRELRGTPGRLANKRDFIVLGPGYLYGTRLALVPKRGGPGPASSYALAFPPGHDASQNFFFSTPGDYSLTVSYLARDSGRMAGVAAWTGYKESRGVHFSISQPGSAHR
jgi:hypothetical protein